MQPVDHNPLSVETILQAACTTIFHGSTNYPSWIPCSWNMQRPMGGSAGSHRNASPCGQERVCVAIWMDALLRYFRFMSCSGFFYFYFPPFIAEIEPDCRPISWTHASRRAWLRLAMDQNVKLGLVDSEFCQPDTKHVQFVCMAYGSLG